MTPSVAASATVVTAALLASGSTAVHDREWWAEEAVRTGTDWSGLVAVALEMMVAAGIIEQPVAQTTTLWDARSWRDAAVEYHRNRAIVGAVISLERACPRCGCFEAVVGSSRGPHFDSLTFANCNRHAGWLPGSQYRLLNSSSPNFATGLSSYPPGTAP
jgi:hypothetical protein